MPDDELTTSTPPDELREILRKKRRQNILLTILAVAVMARLALFLFQGTHH